MLKAFLHKIKGEVVFIVSFILAIITSIVSRPRVDAIDFKVIFLLLDLMLVSCAFKKYKLLDYIAATILNRVRTERSIGFVMILTTAVLGMLITNDVALITVVPITLSISKRANFNPFRIIVLETMAANIGSSLTPFGNPQNLFLYNFYEMNGVSFLGTTAPFVVLGMIFLVLVDIRNSKEALSVDRVDVELGNKLKVTVYLVLFAGAVLSVLHIIPYWLMTIIIVSIVIILDRGLLLKVDYFLLCTFVCFFIFVDNVNRLTFVSNLAGKLLDTEISTYIFSALLSQGISNVPAAVLVSGFTTFKKAVLVGVSVGGLGTLIASLANLIAYKLYTKEFSGKGYRGYFYKWNVIGLIVLGTIMGLWIQFV